VALSLYSASKVTQVMMSSLVANRRSHTPSVV